MQDIPFGEVIVHKLIITPFKTTLGFSAACSCGQRIHRVSGCNRSGCDYGLQAAWDEFQTHLMRAAAKPVKPAEQQGEEEVA